MPVWMPVSSTVLLSGKLYNRPFSGLAEPSIVWGQCHSSQIRARRQNLEPLCCCVHTWLPPELICQRRSLAQAGSTIPCLPLSSRDYKESQSPSVSMHFKLDSTKSAGNSISQLSIAPRKPQRQLLTKYRDLFSLTVLELSVQDWAAPWLWAREGHHGRSIFGTNCLCHDRDRPSYNPLQGHTLNKRKVSHRLFLLKVHGTSK